MLEKLKIQNLILVERAEINFSEGLNILTGETGSGKSAILSAIRLIAADRADFQLIGKNGDLAVVEAFVSGCTVPEEIIIEPKRPLWIRREIHRSGKSRCFIEDQLVSLSTLRQTIGSSIEILDQSSSSCLCSLEEQTKMLDAIADLNEETKKLGASFSLELLNEKKMEELDLAKEVRERDLAWAEEDLKLIEEVNWRFGEEEKIAEEHKILSHSQELQGKVSAALNGLTDPGLKRSFSLLEAAARIDPALNSQANSLKSAILEIEEIKRSIDSYLDRLEVDPSRLSLIEERIGLIEQLKRRFGKTFEAVETKRNELEEKIDRLNHLDEEFASLKHSLETLKKENRQLALMISSRRKKTAPSFSSKILSELKTLNLPYAQFEIMFTEKALSSRGADEIRFLFSANPGHPPIPLEECASGGELSRLLLAIKTVLAEKEGSSTLVFDEIDSNVGGQTAAILGEKLKTIANQSQVICVTHFAQVAKCALAHFAVVKEEKEGRAVTRITHLAPLEREAEYLRMQGFYQR